MLLARFVSAAGERAHLVILTAVVLLHRVLCRRLTLALIKRVHGCVTADLLSRVRVLNSLGAHVCGGFFREIGDLVSANVECGVKNAKLRAGQKVQLAGGASESCSFQVRMETRWWSKRPKSIYVASPTRLHLLRPGEDLQRAPQQWRQDCEEDLLVSVIRAQETAGH